MYFEIERIKRILLELKTLIYQEVKSIESYLCLENECVDLAEALSKAEWTEFPDGDVWGGIDKHYWFKADIVVPQSFEGKRIVYRISTGREGQWDADNPQMLLYLNGKPVQGLDVNHTEVLLSDCGRTGERFDLVLSAHSGMKPGMVYLRSEIAVLDLDTEALYFNLRIPTEVAEQLPEGDRNRIEILKHMVYAINLLDLRKPGNLSYRQSVEQANKYLSEEFYGKVCGANEVVETCIGHTHIDIAWLWTISQTRQKAVRSFTTVLQLMKQYPEYLFMSSQPQLYQFLKEDHPEVYEQIQERVREGRWEVEGAMWLEADCNLASGESLVRQILYGKRFIKKEFDKDSRVLWLPDVFGYSAALPQIMKKSGVDYFMTTKIGWNEYNRMPVDTFLWRGIDGTEVLTHFITTADYKKDGKLENNTTYNGYINGSRVMGCWQRYQNKELTNEVLNCFGHGDGGGGPTKDMLESAKRFEKGIPGSPVVKHGKVLEYFERLEKSVLAHKRLPRWVGELYLEYHRGTYTSMGRNKKYNRKAEFRNQDLELYGVIGSALGKASYPSELLKKSWETTLLNQFHDIIPGSSIEAVYEDSKREYEQIEKLGEEQIDKIHNILCGSMKLEETSVIAFNSLGHLRDDVVRFKLPEGWKNARVFDGEQELPVQLIKNNEAMFFGTGIPSKGWKAFKIKQSEMSVTESFAAMEIAEGGNIHNCYYDITLDATGVLTSIFDKRYGRQVLRKDAVGNRLQAFEDKPHEFDAWNINIYYMEKMWELNACDSIRITEQGPVRTTIEVVKSFGDSKILQEIHVYENFPRIDFHTLIDWKEKDILLKTAFPVEINASKAVYDIQFGNVERPTHWNTSWDYARFEVCAHKWADVSEGGYGVALLNDCKYGYDIRDSVMRLTLLKSATYPNPNADREQHEFMYSLLPHGGDFRQGEVQKQAYHLNCPIRSRVEQAHEGTLSSEWSLVSVDAENVVLETVKLPEESSGDEIVLRMVEAHNCSRLVVCTMSVPALYAEECDLLEMPLETVKLSQDGRSFSFWMKPFEIKTFRIRIGGGVHIDKERMDR